MKPSAVTEPSALRNWDDIEAASNFLEVVAETSYPIDIRQFQDSRLVPALFDPLEDWMASQESGWLWMRGPPGHDELSEVSTTAFYAVLVNEQLEIPLPSYLSKAEYGVAESLDLNPEEQSMDQTKSTQILTSVQRDFNSWMEARRVY